MRNYLKIAALAVLAACALTVTSCDALPSGMAVSFPDLGKADAAVLLTEDAAVVIDTGNEGDGSEVGKLLLEAGKKHIDMLIITHFDKDHAGGARYLLRHFSVGVVILPSYREDSEHIRALESALSAKDIVPTVLTEDAHFPLGGVDYTLLAPTGQYNGANDNSIVVRAVYGDTAFLFCGDIESARIDGITAAEYDLSCDVMKVPHHGRYTESLPSLIEQASPEYAVVTGKADAAAHDALESAGSAVLSTVDDDVHFVSDSFSVALLP